MNYQILTRKEDDLYTLVHVKVNQSDVLNVSSYTLVNHNGPKASMIVVKKPFNIILSNCIIFEPVHKTFNNVV